MADDSSHYRSSLLDGVFEVSEMIERVAKATFHAESEPHKLTTGYGELWGWLDVMPAVRERHLSMARAAIAAMTEPTEEMKDAGAEEDDESHSEMAPTTAVHLIYRAMIKEALK